MMNEKWVQLIMTMGLLAFVLTTVRLVLKLAEAHQPWAPGLAVVLVALPAWELTGEMLKAMQRSK